MVWVGDGAIEAMLEEKLRGRFLFVSGNIINHSTISLVRPTRPAVMDPAIFDAKLVVQSPTRGLCEDAAVLCPRRA